MPIYDYRCQACHTTQSLLFLSLAEAEAEERTAICQQCGKPRLSRILSRFAYHQSEANRLQDFDTGAARDESFYRDSRNVGLWAKKRAREMGVDLGARFEETVEKARSGKIGDEL